MLDFDLQMRFMKSALDAWTGYAAASTAAFEAWQREAQQVLTGKAALKPAAFDMTNANPFMWWMNAFSGVQPMKSPAADFGAGFFQFAPQFATTVREPVRIDGPAELRISQLRRDALDQCVDRDASIVLQVLAASLLGALSNADDGHADERRYALFGGRADGARQCREHGCSGCGALVVQQYVFELPDGRRPRLRAA